MHREPKTWHEIQLFEAGFEQLTLHFVVHLDGPRSQFTSGWTLLATTTGVWVASEVSVQARSLRELPQVRDELALVLNRSVVALSPF